MRLDNSSVYEILYNVGGKRARMLCHGIDAFIKMKTRFERDRIPFAWNKVPR